MNAPTTHPRLSAAGFSLVELLAVMVLIGIGAAMAVPRMDGMIAGTKTRAAIGQLGADLSYARILAVRWGRPTSVRFNATGTEYTVTVDTAGTASPNFRVVKRVRVAQEHPGVVLAGPGTQTQVSFTTRGLVYTGQDGIFKATKGGMVDSLRLYATGRIYRDK